MPPEVKQMIKEQEEQKIFEEFEELGYRIYGKNDYYIFLVNNQTNRTINIHLKSKMYEKFYKGIATITSAFTMKEHQLLHKLFTLWGWFDV